MNDDDSPIILHRPPPQCDKLTPYEHSYGDVVEHPHPDIDRTYTFVGYYAQGYYRLDVLRRRLQGADGGCLDFGRGLGWWLFGEWELPSLEQLDVAIKDALTQNDGIVRLQVVTYRYPGAFRFKNKRARERNARKRQEEGALDV